jgi:hypothetical protein
MDKETGQVSRVACYSIPLYTTPQDQADRIAELEKHLQEAIDGMGGAYAIWAPKAKLIMQGYTTPQTKPLSYLQQVDGLASDGYKNHKERYGKKPLTQESTPQTKPLSDENVMELAYEMFRYDADVVNFYKKEIIEFANKVRGEK